VSQRNRKSTRALTIADAHFTLDYNNFIFRALRYRLAAGRLRWLRVFGPPKVIITYRERIEEMTEKATFGAGCFWGVEATFREIDGVVDALAGYEGGHTAKPTYQDVCTDLTGHAEVVQVEYDPAKVSYDQLLSVFWKAHDPTQVNRQGPDVGTQYRSVIFFHTPEQEQAAQASKAALEASGRLRRPVATSIEPARTFYEAEDYHQQYLAKRGLRHCHI
jgi:peptide-methionine (S)-S-oxide reductase